MLQVDIVENSRFVDFYFMLEGVGADWLPAPHGPLIRRLASSDDPQAASLLRRGFTRLQAVECAENVLLAAVKLQAEQDLVALIGAELAGSCSEHEARSVLDDSRQLRRRIVTAHDLDAARKQSEEITRLIESKAVRALFERISRFFQIPDASPLHFTVVPYALASTCETSFGSLTGSLLVLGLHPHSNAARGVGIIAHEAVHAWIVQVGQGAEAAAVLAAIEEPLATSIGNAWVVSELTGGVPSHSWYDDPAVDRVAHDLHTLITEALARERSFVDILNELKEFAS